MAGTAAAIGVGAAAAWLLSRKPPARPVPDPFSNEHITSTFVVALPTITRELNLEVATVRQMESFERTNARQVLWGLLNLGTSLAVLRVPVTYRYHLKLQDPWRLRVVGERIIVEVLQKDREGVVVQPVEADAKAPASGASAADSVAADI